MNTKENSNTTANATANATTLKSDVVPQSSPHTDSSNSANNTINGQPETTMTKNESFAYWKQRDQQLKPPPTVNKTITTKGKARLSIFSPEFWGSGNNSGNSNDKQKSALNDQIKKKSMKKEELAELLHELSTKLEGEISRRQDTERENEKLKEWLGILEKKVVSLETSELDKVVAEKLNNYLRKSSSASAFNNVDDKLLGLEGRLDECLQRNANLLHEIEALKSQLAKIEESTRTPRKQTRFVDEPQILSESADLPLAHSGSDAMLNSKSASAPDMLKLARNFVKEEKKTKKVKKNYSLYATLRLNNIEQPPQLESPGPAPQLSPLESSSPKTPPESPNSFKVAEKARIVKEALNEIYEGNYDTLRGRRSTTASSGNDKNLRSFATIRRYQYKKSLNGDIADDMIKADNIESIFDCDIITENGVRFVIAATSLLRTYAHLGLAELFNGHVEPSKVQELKAKIEILSVNISSHDPKIVAALLILFFRNFTKPLLDKYIQAFRTTSLMLDKPYRTCVMRSLVYSLPARNHSILMYLVDFVHFMVDYHNNSIEGKEEVAAAAGSRVGVASEKNGGGIGGERKSINTPSNKKVDGNGTDELAPQTELVCQIFDPLLSCAKNTPADDSKAQVFLVLLDDYKPIFLNESKDIEFILLGEEYIVKVASLERLVEKLMDPYYKDSEYSDVVFLCYDYFTNSRQLLGMLLHYYNSLNSPATTIRVLVLLKVWMMMHVDVLKRDKEFISQLTTFIDSSTKRSSQEETFFKYFKTFHQDRVPPQVLFERGLSFAPFIMNAEENFTTNTPLVDPLSIESVTMALQVSLVDHELLRAISLREFAHKRFTKPENSPNFHAMVNKFNEWGMWACTVILSHEKLNERVQAIIYFVELAKNCAEINNFNASCAIIGGLNHSSISRLKTAWEKIPSKYMQDYDKLLQLFDMSMNYRNYREALKVASPPLIPYLGLFPKDLIAVEEGNENYTQEGLVNFEKFRLLSKLIKNIETYQIPLYSAKASPTINSYLRNLKLFVEKDLFAKSLMYDPRSVVK